MTGHRRPSPLVWSLVVLGAAGLLAAGSLGTLLWTEWGRARVCARVNATVSDEIAGRLEVGRIDALTLTRVRASNIKILAPDGRPAIEAESADIEFDPIELLTGHYGWRRAEIERGRVHVTEDARGNSNMEEAFRARTVDPTESGAREAEADGSKLDLRNMVTSDIELIIEGGSLPRLRLVHLYGIMRVHVLANGNTELRFDEYRGTFAKGLPTGTLVFQQVAGHVAAANRRLLRFRGHGRSQGAEVAFKLDIVTEPKTRVKIDARFPHLSPAALPTLGIATWSTLYPALDVNVRFGR